MPQQARLSPMEAKHVGNVTVVRFMDPLTLTGTTAEIVGDELDRLVEGEGRCRLILNFANVRTLTSLMLGKLIALCKKIQAAGGRLALCELSSDLHEIFEVTKLNQYLSIYPNQQDALLSF